MHKQVNVTDHLPHEARTFIARKLRAAWANRDPDAAEPELRSIARSLESAHPGAAASVREGLEETLTSPASGFPRRFGARSKTTKPIESMISIAPRRET